MADLSSLREELATKVQQIHSDALATTLAETIDAAPQKTGALRQTIDVTPSAPVSEFGVSGTIFCSAAYAEWTDAGSDPHVIPGNPWLAFFWERENTWIIRRTRDGHEPFYVNHPGTTGTQWFNGGVDDGEPMNSRWALACDQASV